MIHVEYFRPPFHPVKGSVIIRYLSTDSSRQMFVDVSWGIVDPAWDTLPTPFIWLARMSKEYGGLSWQEHLLVSDRLEIASALEEKLCLDSRLFEHTTYNGVIWHVPTPQIKEYFVETTKP